MNIKTHYTKTRILFSQNQLSQLNHYYYYINYHNCTSIIRPLITYINHNSKQTRNPLRQILKDFEEHVQIYNDTGISLLRTVKWKSVHTLSFETVNLFFFCFNHAVRREMLLHNCLH